MKTATMPGGRLEGMRELEDWTWERVTIAACQSIEWLSCLQKECLLIYFIARQDLLQAALYRNED